MVTDKLGSYPAAYRQLMSTVEHRSVVRNLFVPPHSRRSALATLLHRLTAMAERESCDPHRSLINYAVS
jgi:transposase-like protein